MENTSQQALIPLEQAMIPFHGSQILALRLADIRVGATVPSLCAMVGVRPEMQVRRIRRSKDLAEYLVFALVETAGGPQRMGVLIAEAIPFWVMRLRIDQIAPEKREFIIFLKMEAVEVLYGYFYQGDSERVAQPEPEVEHLARPAGGKSGAAAGSPRERVFAALDDVQEGVQNIREALHDMWESEEQPEVERLARTQRALAGRVEVVEEWVKSLEGRVAGMGQGSAANVGWLPLLSGAHLADMRALLRSLEQATGRTQAQLERELVETFGVPAINAVPEEQWEDVLAWYSWRARQEG